MSKIDLNNVAGGFNLSKINDNFQKIETALNEGALWRDNLEGEPNQMKNDLDMNGKRIYNLPAPIADHEPARFKEIKDVQGAIDQAHLDAQRAKDEADRAKYEADRATAAAGSTDASNLKVFSTKADADLAAATLPDGQRVEIEADETRDGRSTRYVVQSGALSFIGYVDEFDPGFGDTQKFPTILKLRESWNVADFLTGSRTDHTEALQKALTHGADEGFAVNVGNRTWNIEDAVTVSGNLRLFGNSPSASIINFRNGSAGLRQVLTSASQRTAVKGLALLTDSLLTQGKYALQIDATATVVNNVLPQRECKRADFSDLFISSADGALGKGWDTHIDLMSVGWFSASNLNFRGANRLVTSEDYVGRGLLVRGDGTPVEMYVGKIWGYNLKYGIQAPDRVEGLMVENFNFVNVSNGIEGGIYDPETSLLPLNAGRTTLQTIIRSGHINCRRSAVKLYFTNQSTLSDLLIYTNDSGISGITNIDAVQLQTGSNNTAKGLKIFSNNITTDGSVMLRPIRLVGITDSEFSDVTIGAFGGKGKISQAVNLMNGSNNNTFDGLRISAASTGVLQTGNSEGNRIFDHRIASDVVTPIGDQQSDQAKKLQLFGSYSANVLVTIPSGQTTFTYTLPTPAGVFAIRPKNASITAASGTHSLRSKYNYDSSTRTSVDVIFYMDGGAQIPEGTYRFAVQVNE